MPLAPSVPRKRVLGRVAGRSQVHGADRLQAGSYAAVLVNNNHGANFSVNVSAPVFAAALGMRDMRQMVYDVTVVLMGLCVCARAHVQYRVYACICMNV